MTEPTKSPGDKRTTISKPTAVSKPATKRTATRKTASPTPDVETAMSDIGAPATVPATSAAPPVKRTTSTKKSAPRGATVSDADPVAQPAAPMPPSTARHAQPGNGNTRTAQPTPRSAVGPEQRWKMISESAYLRAERNGFAGDPVEYWLAAEAEVDALIKA